MPNSTLDERLHSYFDGLPDTPVPGDASTAMTRGRSRRRHQLVGLVGCVVVFLAGLGVASSTLLDGDDDQSSGPVAVEPGGDEDTAGTQRWYVTDDPDENVASAWSFVHVADDDTLIGVVANLATDGQQRMDGFIEVWRVQDGDRTVVDTGLESVSDMVAIDDELWVLGSDDGQISFAVSADDGTTWSLRHTGEPAPVNLIGANAEAGDGFVVVSIPALGSQTPSELLTFVPGAESGPVARLDDRGDDNPPHGMRSFGDGVMLDASEGEPPLMTTDGRQWVEIEVPTEDAQLIGMLHGEAVWHADDNILVGTHTTDVSELVGFDAFPYGYASDDERMVVVLTSGSADPVVITSDDGSSWDVEPVVAPPRPLAGVGGFGTPLMRIDADDRALLPTNPAIDGGNFWANALLVFDPHAAGTEAPEAEGTASPGRGQQSWIEVPAQADGDTIVDAVGSSVGVIAQTSGGAGEDQVWLWDDGWEPLDVLVGEVRDLSRAGDDVGILAGPVNDDAETPAVHRSTDGGQTWRAFDVPDDAHALALANQFGVGRVALSEEPFRVVRTYTFGAGMNEEWFTSVSDGAFELDEVDGDFWLWDYESPDDGESRSPRRILAGEEFDELEGVDLDQLLVPQGATSLGDMTVWLEGTNATTQIRSDEGLDVAVDSLLDIDGMNEMYVNGLRSWDDGLVVLGSMAGEDDRTLFLVVSQDGTTWTPVYLPIPEDLDWDPTGVRLLDVDRTGRVIIDPGTSDPEAEGSPGMLLVVEPG